jgi:hypothetical protein
MVLMLTPVFSDTSCWVICKAIRVALYLCPRAMIVLAGGWFCGSNAVLISAKLWNNQQIISIPTNNLKKINNNSSMNVYCRIIFINVHL